MGKLERTKRDSLEVFNSMWIAEDRGYLLKGAPSPCHIWQRYVKDDYGRFRNRGAHRWIYIHTIRPLTFEETVDHRCRQKLCVNVKHMEIVSHGENARRAVIDNGKQAKDAVCSECGNKLRRPDAKCLFCEQDRTYIIDPDLTFYQRRVLICNEVGIDPVKCQHGHVVYEEDVRWCGVCKNAATMKNYYKETFYEKRKRIGGEPVKCVNDHLVPNDGKRQCNECMKDKADRHRQKKGDPSAGFRRKRTRPE